MIDYEKYSGYNTSDEIIEALVNLYGECDCPDSHNHTCKFFDVWSDPSPENEKAVANFINKNWL